MDDDLSWLEAIRDVGFPPPGAAPAVFPGWPPTDWLPSADQPWPGEDSSHYPVIKIGNATLAARFGIVVSRIDGDTPTVGVLLFEIPEKEKRVVYHGGFAVVGEWDAVQRWVFSVRPLDWWKRHALYRLSSRNATPETAPPYNSDRSALVERATAWEQTVRTSLEVPVTRRRDRITDAVLQEVAGVYRAAWAAGENPTQAVAHHFHKSGPTASRWVSLARRAGHLKPSDSTRGGEVPDE